MKLKKHKCAGLTLAETLVVVAVIGLVVMIAIPNLAQARTLNRRHICIANLVQIESAKTTWGLEQDQAPEAVPSDQDLFGPGRYLPDKPQCPSLGRYELQPLNRAPTCARAAEEGHALDGQVPSP